MQETPFVEVVKAIRAQDRRYEEDGYFFVRNALDFTAKTLGKPSTGANRHITGGELLEGIRAFAIQEFGPMALTVFHTWGIRTTEDFGEIVFNLVEAGVLGKTDTDRRSDFSDGFDFREAFARPFLPDSMTRQRRQRGAEAKRNVPARKQSSTP
jgi:uncharacterized repeat protein (TIGR04138 family)